MLGKLAKWLRVLGQDVIYGQHLTGYGLIRAARAGDRLILTRDRRLKQRQPPPYILIDSDDYHDQVRQVVEVCQLTVGAALFTRCVVCNAALQPKPKKLVETRVPDYVFATQVQFSWCPGCRKTYWPATHHQRMLEELRKMGIG